jgi:hypothetical protein
MSDIQKISQSGPDNVVAPSTHSNGPTFPGEQKQSPGMKMSHPLGCQCSECKLKIKHGM